MVLLGLRAGVIGTMIERMDRDPAMRLALPEVTGGNRFDGAWLDRLRAVPRVAFVLPITRLIVAQFELVDEGVDRQVAQPTHLEQLDRKSTRLNPFTNEHLVRRLLLETKKHTHYVS